MIRHEIIARGVFLIVFTLLPKNISLSYVMCYVYEEGSHIALWRMLTHDLGNTMRLVVQINVSRFLDITY